MIRFLLFLSFTLFLASTVYAQDGLTGRIYEDKTNIAIPGIVVRNLKTNKSAISDQTGGYSIPAKIGDLVVFTGFSYQADTLYVKDLKYTVVMLILKGKALKEVNVTEQEVKLGRLKGPRTLSPINSDAVVYSRDGAGDYNGGITTNLFDSHDAEKKRQKAAQLEKDGAIKQHIAEVFSPKNLQNYLPIKGQELENFIVLYIPDIPAYTSQNFNLSLYLNNCYKEFLKIPEEKRRSKQLIEINSKP